MTNIGRMVYRGKRPSCIAGPIAWIGMARQLEIPCNTVGAAVSTGPNSHAGARLSVILPTDRSGVRLDRDSPAEERNRKKVTDHGLANLHHAPAA